MQTTVTLIAKLSRIDKQQAQRAWMTAGAVDSVNFETPAEFQFGRPAFASATCYMLRQKRLKFLAALASLAVFFTYLTVHLTGLLR